MIKIDNEFSIKTNKNCYTLECVGIVQDKKSKNYGEEFTSACGYYSSIEGALKGYIKIKTRKFVSQETEHSLQDLLVEIERLHEYIEKIVKGM